MVQCNTVVFLQQVAAEGGEFASVARNAMGIIEDISKSKPENKELMLSTYIPYLHELIDHIYADKKQPLLEHLVDSPDCELCANLIKFEIN